MKAKRNHSGRIEATAGLKAVDAARFVHRRAFEAACRHDGIDPSAPFVVFSDKNPFVQFVNSAWAEYCARRSEYQSGGYVGLTMEA